jgi:hypothetical protein
MISSDNCTTDVIYQGVIREISRSLDEVTARTNPSGQVPASPQLDLDGRPGDFLDRESPTDCGDSSNCQRKSGKWNGIQDLDVVARDGPSQSNHRHLEFRLFF